VSAARGQRQRRLERVLGHVDTGTVGDEKPRDLAVAVHARLHERRVHLVCPVLAVGAPLKQELAHVRVALVGGQRERRLLELVRARVDLGARLHENARALHIARTRRLHERRVAVLVRLLELDAQRLAPVLEGDEELDNWRVVALDGVVEGRVATGGLGVRIGAVFEQERRDLGVAIGARLYERRGRLGHRFHTRAQVCLAARNKQTNKQTKTKTKTNKCSVSINETIRIHFEKKKKKKFTCFSKCCCWICWRLWWSLKQMKTNCARHRTDWR
jgi:hypothetical protein